MKPHEVKVEFDVADPINVGRPKYFDPDHYCDAIEQMLTADEVITALKMFDQAPAFYRERPTERMQTLKREILQHAWNVSSYAKDPAETYETSLAWEKKMNPGQIEDLGDMIDIPFCYPRGPLMVEEVKRLNEEGKSPHIWEMGPANFWLPYGLKKKGLHFSYYADTLQPDSLKEAKTRLQNHWADKADPDQVQIFCCFETLEHLWQPEDILHQYHRYGASADIIMMSTPLGTLLGGVPDWHRDIGHLRTFTPQEFLDIANRLFPGYKWEIYPSAMMTIVGRR